MIKIEGYQNLYYFDQNGVLYSAKTDKELKAHINKQGYKQVGLYKDGVYKTYLLHRLVFETFYRKIQPNEQVHHINHNRLDNRPSNLVALNSFEHTSMHSKGKKTFLGKVHSEQSKQKMKEAWLKRKQSQDYKNRVVLKDKVTGRFVKNAQT